MGRFRDLMRVLLSRLQHAASESAHYSRYNAPMIGVLGAIGFPLYYYIWEFLFPQPYENLGLRMTGAVVCLPLLFYRQWPERLMRQFSVYWLFALTYALPFLFTYFLLRNQINPVWSMSTMAALFLVVLAVSDWVLVVLISVIGTLLAWVAFLLTTDAPIPLQLYIEQLPIYAFVVLAGSVFNYTSEMVKEEKLDAYSSVGRNIAHELRTPLLGIRAAIAAVSHYLPDLLDSHEQAVRAGLPVKQIRASRFTRLRDAVRRIDDEITYSNTIIDMLLLSAGHNTLHANEFSRFSAEETIRQALERYPFNSQRERDLVRWQEGDDFEYLGSDLLVTHILFNLIKNALHSVLSAGHGDITIRAEVTPESNLIVVEDTGPGIPESELRYIFQHFYTSKRIGQGTGIGLSFCKLVMESFNGSISCQSIPGEVTRFTLAFPGLDRE